MPTSLSSTLRLFALLALAGCSTGTLATTTEPSNDPPDDPWSLDEDGGPYPDDEGKEGVPLPLEDGGPKPPETEPRPEDAGDPPDPPAPPPEDAGDTPEPVFDAGTPPMLDAGTPPTPVDAGTPPTPVDAGTAPPVEPSLPALLPRYLTVFSRRAADNAPDYAIENLLVALINRAVPRSRVRVAVYHFTRDRVADALIAAQARGVDVRVLLDGAVRALTTDPNDGPDVTVVASLILGLGRSRVTLCQAPGSACLGTGIMHHKTFLFSDVGGGSRHVVVQASHNLTGGQVHRHNNAVLVRGDSRLFAAYEATFEQQRRDRVQLDYYRVASGDYATRAYFFPRAHGDTAVSVIDNVTCAGGGRIRAAMAFFTDARLEVARALRRRRAAGCSVEMVVGDEGIRVGRRVLRELRDGGVTVTLYPGRSGGWGLHSKYLLIDARYAGSAARRQLVFTGSHNWTGGALRTNDETMLRLDHDSVFNAFMDDWAHVRDSARRR